MTEKIVAIADSVTVGELATTLNLPVTTLIGELFKNGIAATINQRLDFETASIIVEELGLEVTLKKKEAAVGRARVEHTLSERAVPRPPIVAVMGHVDHGKTSLLDAILDNKTAAGEAGGITQHISAYQTRHNGRMITLLDTPGHEAFAALRQHGAVLTDVVIIVVAADDGVKPQTVEAIRFARSANAKIVVAINKIDKDTANPQLVKTQLASEHGLNPEEWGGDTVMVEVSAKTGQNLDKLLDMVLLVADMEDLRADEDVPAEGLVIEAGPSTPVNVTGFKELPQFGHSFRWAKNEKEARHLAQAARLEQEKMAASTNVTSSDILKMMSQQHDAESFNVLVKADVQGSLTSVIDSLKLIDTGGLVDLHVIGSGVGNISENDIHLAVGENTVIYGFNVDLPPAVKRLAAREHVEVRLYRVIYELLDNAKQSMEALLAPEVVETEVGRLSVKGVFRTVREEVIAGGEVMTGKVYKGLLARLKRGDEHIAEVEVSSVQRQHQEAKEVFEGEMCGLSLKTTRKVVVEEGDTLEFFTRELVKKTL